MAQKVYVGMSGGVDSSVTAALLKERGYNVTGVYMKNWAKDLPGFVCPWREDLADAKRVAVQLGIDFKIYDFQKEYKQTVVDYMIEEYQAGLTPNPDIMCNQEVKFRLFLDTALADGADLISTGHYARVVSGPAASYAPSRARSSSARVGATPRGVTRASVAGDYLPSIAYHLLRPADEHKDQTYFLYRVSEEGLSKTLFPLSEITKPEVREIALRLGLVNAKKKDSVGICFVGQVGIKDFLSNFVKTKPGSIIDKLSGKAIGSHDGAIFYTIGQRHGLDVGGGLPYYVIGKDMTKNIVYVTTDLDDEDLWKKDFKITSPHWINPEVLQGDSLQQGISLQVRTRHLGKLVNCQLEKCDDSEDWLVKLDEPQRALAPGQSAVIYEGETVLGGGIIV